MPHHLQDTFIPDLLLYGSRLYGCWHSPMGKNAQYLSLVFCGRLCLTTVENKAWNEVAYHFQQAGWLGWRGIGTVPTAAADVCAAGLLQDLFACLCVSVHTVSHTKALLQSAKRQVFCSGDRFKKVKQKIIFVSPILVGSITTKG